MYYQQNYRENYQHHCNREKLLEEVMAVDFALVDLNLYLNTHPYDQNVIALYNNTVQKSRMLRGNFEKMYGPLTANNINSGNTWQWIKNPWPWQAQ